jgi:Na+/H+ antiporter NhaC
VFDLSFAGAFATVTSVTGGVDAVVNLGIENINSSFFPLGIFVIASFLSTATGTSVGCIVALGPIAISLADKSGASLPLIGGALLGGAMFGDNLSMISDTTIAVTQSLECQMKDKFKINLLIALPAAILTLLVLLFFGYGGSQIPVQAGSYQLISILPYILVIVLAVIGINVFVTLIIGIVAAGVLGFTIGDFTILTFSKAIYQGFTSMTDIFLLSMLTGGLATLVEKAGGIAFLLHQIKKRVKSKRSAQMGIGALVGLINVAIANNTVSIVVTGGIAKEINDEFGLNAKKTATILDIFSCIFQGLLPYGAQVLLIISFSKGALSWIDLVSNAWYYFFFIFSYNISYIYQILG